MFTDRPSIKLKVNNIADSLQEFSGFSSSAKVSMAMRQSIPEPPSVSKPKVVGTDDSLISEGLGLGI